eukprot:TRINITY_DN2201_c0_g1_i5.p1 TRINITY_DN2201_c0_g1~~TRINITY_DN2201_c0_g1_i5.p1  ORF type:complete len:366 (+),score=36.71 TRINITY_DN2201_c0_g1_i5:92-1189(+)
MISILLHPSNEWTGKQAFHGRSLHALGNFTNPYEEAITIVAKTLSAFDDDKLIPCYGFGDGVTHDRSVFSFNPGDQPCHGLEHVLQRYRQIVPHVQLSGPTSFAPVIRQAMNIVQQSGFQYHILVIIADGQVTRSVDTGYGQLSAQEQETAEAIVMASQMPLSIIVIGVGDGPWDQMKAFDDLIPSRRFDNLQFVNFTDITRKLGGDQHRREAAFALSALMEIPDQYKIILRLKLLNQRSPAVTAKPVAVQPPPQGSIQQAAPPSAPMYPSQGIQGQQSSSGAAPQPKQGEQPPDVFICPITSDLMNDPVMAVDGYTYERKAIEEWFQQHSTSPMTNQPMDKTLIPNHSLRSSIMEYKQSKLKGY